MPTLQINVTHDKTTKTLSVNVENQVVTQPSTIQWTLTGDGTKSWGNPENTSALTWVGTAPACITYSAVTGANLTYDDTDSCTGTFYYQLHATIDGASYNSPSTGLPAGNPDPSIQNN